MVESAAVHDVRPVKGRGLALWSAAAFALVGLAVASYFAQRPLSSSDAAPRDAGSREAQGRAMPVVSGKPDAAPDPASPAVGPERAISGVAGAAGDARGAPAKPGAVRSDAPAPGAAKPVAEPRPAQRQASAPASVGPCTEAVAALGLCTPESTQRKEP